jgi:hypothetical protein
MRRVARGLHPGAGQQTPLHTVTYTPQAPAPPPSSRSLEHISAMGMLMDIHVCVRVCRCTCWCSS